MSCAGITTVTVVTRGLPTDVWAAVTDGQDSIASIRYTHTLVVGKGFKKAPKIRRGDKLMEVELANSKKRFGLVVNPANGRTSKKYLLQRLTRGLFCFGFRIPILSPVTGMLFGHNMPLLSDPSLLISDSRLQFVSSL